MNQNSQPAADTDCNMPCSGNSSEVCGAGNRLSVFTNGQVPVTNNGVNGSTFVDCYTDSVSSRTLRYIAQVPGGSNAMTVASCVSACSSSGYLYAGVEYAGECWCDNTIGLSAVSRQRSCNMPCKGNTSEYCGGSDMLDIYKLPLKPVSCSVSSASYGFIKNGGFESGATSWTFSPSGVAAMGVSQEGYSYDGCSEVAITPLSNTYAFQQAFLQQSVSGLTQNKQYTFTFYLGLPPGTTNTGNPTIGVVILNEPAAEFTLSNGGFGLKGNNGAMYSKVSIPFTAYTSSGTFSIAVTWTGGGSTPSSPLFVDDISIN
jgi:hypothetical protein